MILQGELKELIEVAMLNIDPLKRPNSFEIIAKPFVQRMILKHIQDLPRRDFLLTPETAIYLLNLQRE